MLRDVAPGAPPVVALVQAAKREARLVQRLDPGQTLQFGEVARAQLQQVVKAALGDDEPAVHIEFAERQRRIEHQLPFRRAIGELDAERRPRAVAERLDDAVGGLDFQTTLANQSPQKSPERRAHPLAIPIDWPAVPTAPPSLSLCQRYGKLRGFFKCESGSPGIPLAQIPDRTRLVLAPFVDQVRRVPLWRDLR